MAVENKRTCTSLLANTGEAGILIETDVFTCGDEVNCDGLYNVLRMPHCLGTRSKAFELDIALNRSERAMQLPEWSGTQ